MTNSYFHPSQHLLSNRFLSSIGGRQHRLVLLILNFRLPPVTLALWKHGATSRLTTKDAPAALPHCLLVPGLPVSLSCLSCSAAEDSGGWRRQPAIRYAL